MGHHHNFFLRIICLLFLMIPSLTQLRSMAQGMTHHKPVDFDFDFEFSKVIGEDRKMVVRGRVGSRPPRCERMCSWCGHCEAIQVPTTSCEQQPAKTKSSNEKGDGATNYKPMSWKCKCGSFIFNP